MFSEKFLPAGALAGLALLSACSSSDSTNPEVVSALQNLTTDPTGLTTVVSFSDSVGSLTASQFEADGGQTAQSATPAGNTYVVVWDQRVTPSHQVRVTGVENVAETFISVTTSDSSAPTFSVASATVTTGWGGDTINVQFSGPNVVAVGAEEPTNWQLRVSGLDIDLDSSSFLFNDVAQSLQITTDATSNVHSSFELIASNLVSVSDVAMPADPIAGSAAGDSVAPTLVSATQNLSEDEFGRVIDFVFSESMDPNFATQNANFSLGFPVTATSVSQLTETSIRATFADPVVPASDTVSLVNMLDAHGNAFAGGAVAISAGSVAANAYDGSPEVRTVSGLANDELIVVTTQALDPSTATDNTAWTLTVDSTPVDLTSLTFGYTLLTKTLEVEIPQDFINGDAFTLTPVSISDVDGESFSTPFSGTVAGDSVPPSISSVMQNRTVDPSGQSIDVRFQEDVDQTAAETTSNYTFSGGQTVLSATLQTDTQLVRVVLDAPGVPNLDTIDVAGVGDPAGNTMTPVATQPFFSSDTTQPSITSVTANGIEGIDNDTIEVVFDDNMVESDIIDPTKWTVESPESSPLDVTLATIAYDDNARTATLTFDGGDDINFQTGVGARVILTLMRDIGGNGLPADPFTTTPMVEANFPIVEAAWVYDAPSNNIVGLRFSEPIANSDDADSVYDLLDSGDNFVANPSSVTPHVDGFGADLTFGSVVTPGSNTLDIAGVTDAAGNSMFPSSSRPLSAENASEVALDGPSSALSAVLGERNDQIVVTLDSLPSGWGLENLDNFSLDSGGPLGLGFSSVTWDGGLNLTIQLEGSASPNLETGASYTVGIDNIISAQGIAQSSASTAVVTVAGDSVAPDLEAAGVTLDPQNAGTGVLIEFSEAMDPTGAVNTANFQIDGVNPDSVTQLGPRTVRAVLAAGVSAGELVDITLDDLAGNSGVLSQAISAADATAPLLGGLATATMVSGSGGDFIQIDFSEPVDPSASMDSSNYSLTMDAAPIDLTAAVFDYSSVGNVLTIELPAGTELQTGSTLQVTVSNQRDWSGNAMSTPSNITAVLGGDSTAPQITNAFVNTRFNPFGLTIDVKFDEDVNLIEVADFSNWSIDNGLSVVAAESMSSDAVRLTLDGTFVTGAQLSLTSFSDLAGNTTASQDIVPID